MSHGTFSTSTLTLLFAGSPIPTPPASKSIMLSTDRIQPYPQNPFYWQYKGLPVLTLGAA